jgi:hypothetical protein
MKKTSNSILATYNNNNNKKNLKMIETCKNPTCSKIIEKNELIFYSAYVNFISV